MAKLLTKAGSLFSQWNIVNILMHQKQGCSFSQWRNHNYQGLLLLIIFNFYFQSHLCCSPYLFSPLFLDYINFLLVGGLCISHVKCFSSICYFLCWNLFIPPFSVTERSGMSVPFTPRTSCMAATHLYRLWWLALIEKHYVYLGRDS